MTERTIDDVVTIDKDGHIATVWFDRPDARNAFGPEFWFGLPDVIATLNEEDDVRVIVIAARGTAFTAGLDLKAFGPALVTGGLDPAAEPPASPVAGRMGSYQLIKKMQRTFTALAESPKPIIAAVNGYCIGAGVELITACDIRYASEDAVFSVRETRLAMVADTGTMQRLPLIVEPGRAREIIFTGRDFDAAEALEIGLVSRVLPNHDAVVKHAMETARQIAANSPLAVQGAKHVLGKADGLTVEEQLDYIAVWNAAFINSSDLTEAISAYVEKRPPEFRGH